MKITEINRNLRKERIEVIKQLIQNSKGLIKERKFVAELSLKWGLSPRKIKEYIRLLVDTNQIVKTPDGHLKPASFVKRFKFWR